MHPLHYCWAKPQHKQNLAVEKSIASTEAFSLFLKHGEVVWWLCISSFISVGSYESTHGTLLLLFLFYSVETNVSS